MTSFNPHHQGSTRSYAVFDSLSVIITTPASGGLPRCAIDSALAQLLPVDQLVLVSMNPDTTFEMTMLADDDHRVTVVHLCDCSPGAVRNSALHFSASNYVLFLDDGSELTSGALAALRHSIQTSRSPDMLVGGYAVQGKREKLNLRPQTVLDVSPVKRLNSFLIKRDLRLNQCAVAFRKAALGCKPYPVSLPDGTDIPVIASLLARGRCVAVPGILATIRRRHAPKKVERFKPSDYLKIVDEVFQRLPDDLQGLKNRDLGQVCLSGYVSSLRNGWYGEGRVYFLLAVRWAPMRALKWCYLKKVPWLLHY
jgi:hypothetical protein